MQAEKGDLGNTEAGDTKTDILTEDTGRQWQYLVKYI